MLKFQEESLRQSVNGALALRHQINPFLDAIFEKGIANVCFLGIGGTYASAMQTVSHMKEFTSMEVFAENAAEYNNWQSTYHGWYTSYLFICDWQYT